MVLRLSGQSVHSFRQSFTAFVVNVLHTVVYLIKGVHEGTILACSVLLMSRLDLKV